MKAFLLILLFHLVLIFPGCGTLDSSRGGPGEETPGAGVSTKDLQMKNAELEQELQRTRDRGELELARAKDENRRLMERIKELEEENKSLREGPPEKDEAGNSKGDGEAAREAMKSLKIKVLSGTGELGSAKRLARKLRELGYLIAAVDYAPRKNFLQDTIYFPQRLKQEAERIASSLGSGRVLKTLTWATAFDLIIVAGKNP